MLTFLHLHPCNSLTLLNSSLPFHNITTTVLTTLHKCSLPDTTNINSVPFTKPTKTLTVSTNSPTQRGAQLLFCSRNGVFDEISNTQLPEKPQNDGIEEIEELELRGKPSPLPTTNGSASELLDTESKKPDKDEVLAPFLRFFKPRDSLEVEKVAEEGEVEVTEGQSDPKDDPIFEEKKVLIEYYEPKPGDFVVGVVVSGNENKLDVNVGADLLGTMLTKEVLPLYDKEMENLLCDVERDAEDFMSRGKMGIVRNDDAVSGGPVPGRPVVETGTVLFAEVLGRTLSGRPLLSTRRFFRRIAWHRVRQVLFLLFLYSSFSLIRCIFVDNVNMMHEL